MHHMTWREDLDALRFFQHIFKVILSSGLQGSLRSTGQLSWRISQPAAQSKLRELRQRARSACFVPVMAINKPDFLAGGVIFL